MNGGSQAVRLPADMRFDSEFVYVRRDERTGDVILSSRPQMTWAEFRTLQEELGPLTEEEFSVPRDCSFEDRDPFAGWEE